jgi:hypothetical protein
VWQEDSKDESREIVVEAGKPLQVNFDLTLGPSDASRPLCCCGDR